MSKVELTSAKLTKLRQKAETVKKLLQNPWKLDHYYVSDEESDFIAEADPATVLALVEEIETLKRALQELTWDLCGIDLEQEQIDKICNEWIDKAKMLLESEAEHGK